MIRAVLIITIFIGFVFQSYADSSINSEFSQVVRFPVEKFQMDNGLTVLLYKNHSVPLISFHQWFRVGSSHEQPGRTGLAHFFEHLMFKGTNKYTARQFERLIQANGGTNNAFTTHDYTGYFENMPEGTLELIIDIEADRMKNLNFNLPVIQKEREVVKEERRYRVENSVYGYLLEAMFATVYKVHPYRWPVIGYMKDLNATSLDDLKKFYQAHYAPNNAVVVIAGSFDKLKAKRWVKKYYGSIPSQKLLQKKIPEEPQQNGIRRVTLKKDVQNVTLAVAYPGAAAGSKEAYVLDIISNIMGDGTSSRLYKSLVYRQQIMTSVGTWSYSPRYPGFFVLYGAVKPGLNSSRSLSLLSREVELLRRKGVSQKELSKAKNQIMMSYISGLKTISGRAQSLASSEIMFGDYNHMFKELDIYSSITREDILEVAKKYFDSKKQSIIKVVPKK